MTTEEKLSISLYAKYKIAEWSEKCQVLTTEEKLRVLGCLLTGTKDELLELVKLPFPAFVTEYFKSFKDYDHFFRDPTFGYKLYFLTPDDLRYFTERMRTPKKNKTAILAEFDIPTKDGRQAEFDLICRTPLEDLPRLTSASRRLRTFEIKYAYLTQYIDAEEARRLNLRIADSFDRDGVDGYDLEGKLALLNPTMKSIMIHYLGLYGHKRVPKITIIDALNLRTDQDKILKSHDIALKSVDTFFPNFTKTLGAFAHYLGYNEKRQVPGNMIEYSNKTLRDMNIFLETGRIANNLPREAKIILSNYSARERTLYLAAKYMYKTPESLARNLVITPKEAADLLAKINKEQGGGAICLKPKR